MRVSARTAIAEQDCRPRVCLEAGDQRPGRDEKLDGAKAPPAVHTKALQKEQRFTKRQLWVVKWETWVTKRNQPCSIQPCTLLPPRLLQSGWLEPMSLATANLRQHLLGNFPGFWDGIPRPVSTHPGETMNKITSKQSADEQVVEVTSQPRNTQTWLQIGHWGAS